MLASGIAHDLNNVFTPILTLAQVMALRQQNLDERSQEMLKILESSTKRGASLVKQILVFTRGTEGNRITLQIEPLLLEVIKVVKQTFPKTIEIRQKIAQEPLWSISADPTHLHQVFSSSARKL